jgi:hypothetical protein
MPFFAVSKVNSGKYFASKMAFPPDWFKAFLTHISN